MHTNNELPSTMFMCEVFA